MEVLLLVVVDAMMDSGDAFGDGNVLMLRTSTERLKFAREDK